jgi:hypothetical protein
MNTQVAVMSDTYAKTQNDLEPKLVVKNATNLHQFSCLDFNFSDNYDLFLMYKLLKSSTYLKTSQNITLKMYFIVLTPIFNTTKLVLESRSHQEPTKPKLSLKFYLNVNTSRHNLTYTQP